VGHDACGNQVAGTVTGGLNTCPGDDADRNMTGTFNNHTLLGTNAGRVVAANGKTIIGGGAGVASSTGGNNTIIGLNAGGAIATGASNVILGSTVATTTFAGRRVNVLITADNFNHVDTPGANN